MPVALPRGRSVVILLATLAVVVTGAVAAPTARATNPTWYYSEGVVGTPFSFVAPLNPLLTMAGDTDQSLQFQVTAAPADQVSAIAATSQIDLPMPAGPGVRKTVLTIGGHLDLNGVRDVNVSLRYNIDSRTVGGQLLWNDAGTANPGLQTDFTIQLPDYAGGTTFAYEVIFTAPAGMVMTSPIVLDDITIGYGPYVKPPVQKGDGGGTGNDKGKTGRDKGTSRGSNTGRGTGAGAGAGSGTGNGAGTGGTGSGGSDGGASTHALATTATTAQNAVKSTTTHTATARTDTPLTSQKAIPAATTTHIVQGYTVVATVDPSAAGPKAAATATGGSAAAAGGGHSVGGGTGLGPWATYGAFGAIIFGLLLLPVPFVARRLRRVARYEHGTVAGDSWHAEATR